MIRVLIVDDSTVFSDLFSKILKSDSEIEVVGRARNGLEAVEFVDKLRPNVITMDINMPLMDGVTATEEIMRKRPTPIIVVSSLINKKERNICFNALKAGAVDVMEKPVITAVSDYKELEDEMVRRIKVAAGVKLFTPLWVYRSRENKETCSRGEEQVVKKSGELHKKIKRVIVIGASTGGPVAISALLSALPHDFPVPCLVVQHIARGFLDGLVDWLGKECRIKVKIANQSENLECGTAYFPPEDEDIGFYKNETIKIYKTQPYEGHRPSITTMMKGAAETFGAGVIGVLLTGMGRDGVEGLKAIRAAGGRTIVQDEATSAVFGMPKEAIDSNAADYVLPLDKIAKHIMMMV